MEQGNSSSVTILHVCKVFPISTTTNLEEELTLPLTLFDTRWIDLPPLERLFFYSVIDDDDPSYYFLDSILAKLKHSLSLTLRHYLPLAGNLTMLRNSSEPFIVCKPGDSVSLTIAQSVSDFNCLSSNGVRGANQSHPLLPLLECSLDQTQVPLMALQITLFPKVGFSIGMSCHHGLLDGKTVSTFMKSWAYFCQKLTQQDNGNNNLALLPIELTPIYDRTVIVKDSTRLDRNQWLKMYPKRFKVSPDMVRGTFELTPEDVEKLKKRLQCLFENAGDEEELEVLSERNRFSTRFVVAYAYVTHCMINSTSSTTKESSNNDEKFYIGFFADYRSRLNSLVPYNYFGNCGGIHGVDVKARECMGEGGFARIAKGISDAIKRLEKINNNVYKEAMDESISKWLRMEPENRVILLGGSLKFGAYGLDFGWGRPIKSEVTSIDRSGSVSMAESRSGNEGVEFGVVLAKDEMDRFVSLFFDGLKNLSN